MSDARDREPRERDTEPVIEPFGDAGLRVRLSADFDARALLAALRSLQGVVDAVVTERHALVTFDPASPPHDVAASVANALGARLPNRPRTHRIGVRYAGIDLDDVARTCGMSRSDVITLHAGGDYVVAAVGFLPGFGYLRGLDARLVVPRRAVPRIRVEALSVAIAGPYTGIYPFASPGGWSVLGTAEGFTPFDPRSGASLELGDRVRFVAS